MLTAGISESSSKEVPFRIGAFITKASPFLVVLRQSHRFERQHGAGILGKPWGATSGSKYGQIYVPRPG